MGNDHIGQLARFERPDAILQALNKATIEEIAGGPGKAPLTPFGRESPPMTTAELNAFIAAGNIPREAPQYQKFMMILFFIVSIPPAIGSILSVIPTWHYCLDDKEHERILGELNARRHAAEAEKAGDGS